MYPAIEENKDMIKSVILEEKDKFEPYVEYVKRYMKEKNADIYLKNLKKEI